MDRSAEPKAAFLTRYYLMRVFFPQRGLVDGVFAPEQSTWRNKESVSVRSTVSRYSHTAGSTLFQQ
jgi:hypothetical protein